MKRWLVYTPEVGTVIPVTDEGQGPMEYGADVVEIEAETRRDAIALGVKYMLAHGWNYASDQVSDRCSPYTGVKAEPADVEDTLK